MVNLLLIHVSVVDNETQRPVQNLNVSDFEIFEDSATLRPAIFLVGSQPGSVIWFLLNCPERFPGKVGSESEPWNSGVIRSALNNLDGTYTFGVADWCNADANIDLPPTQNRELLLSAIDGILRRAPIEFSDVASVLGFQSSLHQIADESNLQNTRSLRAIVLLDGEKLALPKDEADLTAKRLLYNGVILYQVRNRPDAIQRGGPLTLASISEQTGGLVYSVPPEQYGNAMDGIFNGLNFQYTIGVMPLHLFDHQWHELRVQLTDNARKAHKSVRVAHGTGYLSATSPYSISNYQQAENPEVEVGSAPPVDEANAHGIHFAADTRAFVGSDHLVEFNLRINADQLAWANLSDGTRQSQMVVTFTSYSEKGRELARNIERFEIVRDEAHLPITGEVPFTHSHTIILPDNASRVRITVTDVTAAKTGSQDFSVQEILSSPRERAVIR